jgi:hypothetical protein
MEQAVPTLRTSALRAKLRGTWLHDIVNKSRDLKRRVMRRSEGEAVLLRTYSRVHGKPLNLSNPQTFTEKLFWRMITWNQGAMPARFRELTDKYAVRSHVANIVGEEYLVKLLWHGVNPHAIPFDQLPADYVIKPNHASERVIVVKGSADRDDIIRNVSDWLSINYYWQGREYQYYHVTPRIMIEECLSDQDGNLPLDYKFYCFNGRPELILVRNHTHDISPFFDTSWNLVDLSCDEDTPRPVVPKPTNLGKMIALAAKLSAGFGFVRVDLYNVRGRVYFGELTFTPRGGHLKFSPEGWDAELGKKWDMALDAGNRTDGTYT